MAHKPPLNLCGKQVIDGLNNKASVLKKKSDNSKGKQIKVRLCIYSLLFFLTQRNTEEWSLTIKTIPHRLEHYELVLSLRTASHLSFIFFFPSACLSLDVCKAPTEVPKFEWLNKYQKTTRSQGVVQQALSPFGTALNQQKETGLWPEVCLRKDTYSI